MVSEPVDGAVDDTRQDDKCPGWQMSGMANVRDGKCPGWQMSGMANVRDGKCPGWQMSRDGKGPGWQRSGMAKVRDGKCPGCLNMALSRIRCQIKCQISRKTCYTLKSRIVASAPIYAKN